MKYKIPQRELDKLARMREVVFDLYDSGRIGVEIMYPTCYIGPVKRVRTFSDHKSKSTNRANRVGKWLSLVEHSVREGVPSNLQVHKMITIKN